MNLHSRNNCISQGKEEGAVATPVRQLAVVLRDAAYQPDEEEEKLLLLQ